MKHVNILKSRESGFTLVELSIVLVIIGLIVSSVLVGQDLVRSAELRSTISQLESFNAAVGTFRGKYGGLPGDISGATNYGFTGDGNNDAALGASTDLLTAGTAPIGENVDFWNHLGSTGAALIPGSFAGASVTSTNIASELPAAKAGNYWGVYSVSGINYYYLGVVGAASGVYATSNTLTPLEAKNIDEKVDDGKPNKGIVTAKFTHATDADTAIVAGAAGVGGYEASSAAGTGVNCTNGAAVGYTGVVQYNVKNNPTTAYCNLRFKMPL